eukprot:gb/GEZN01017804.1/.p1 GENE.gb/GEZN01017804.1/~~gb/GEZN01017804.1/.p1  ORF type:complete len:244 (-),score=59.11 gb/GEZN01017804.1/:51-704(-)
MIKSSVDSMKALEDCCKELRRQQEEFQAQTKIQQEKAAEDFKAMEARANESAEVVKMVTQKMREAFQGHRNQIEQMNKIIQEQQEEMENQKQQIAAILQQQQQQSQKAPVAAVAPSKGDSKKKVENKPGKGAQWSQPGFKSSPSSLTVSYTEFSKLKTEVQKLKTEIANKVSLKSSFVIRTLNASQIKTHQRFWKGEKMVIDRFESADARDVEDWID